MIVTATKGAQNARQLSDRSPVQAQFGNGRPDQGTDKHKVAAPGCAGNPAKPAELADPDPVMRVRRDRLRVGKAAQTEEQHRPPAAKRRLRNGKWDGPGAANDPERRVAGNGSIRRRHATSSAIALLRRIALESGRVPPRTNASTDSTSGSPA